MINVIKLLGNVDLIKICPITHFSGFLWIKKFYKKKVKIFLLSIFLYFFSSVRNFCDQSASTTTTKNRCYNNLEFWMVFFLFGDALSLMQKSTIVTTMVSCTMDSATIWISSIAISYTIKTIEKNQWAMLENLKNEDNFNVIRTTIWECTMTNS